MPVRSIKDGSWYWISKVVLDKYADKIKPIGLALYNIYAYYSNKEGLAYPSQRKIADILKISIPTLIKYNKILEKEGLIEIVKVKGKSNRIYLLYPQDIKDLNDTIKRGLDEGIKDFKTNKNNINKNKNNINDLIDYFKEQVRNRKGFEPEVDAKDIRLLNKMLNKYSIDDIKDIIDYYLYSLSDKLGVSIKAMLSSHSINLWKQSKQMPRY